MARLLGCLWVHEIIQFLHFILLTPGAERHLVLTLLILTPIVLAVMYRWRARPGLIWMRVWLFPLANALILVPVLVFAYSAPWVKVDDLGLYATGYQYAINPYIQYAFNGLLFFGCLFVWLYPAKRSVSVTVAVVFVQGLPSVVWLLVLLLIGEWSTASI